MRSVWVYALTLAACIDFSATPYSPVEKPSLSAVLQLTANAPEDGEAGVDVDTELQLFVSLPVDPTTLSVAVSPEIDLRFVGWSVDGTTASYAFSAPLAYATSYTVGVAARGTGGEDLGGRSSFGFTTRVPPAPSTKPVVSVSPSNGTQNVPAPSDIVLTFDRSMDVESLSISLVPPVALPAVTWNTSATEARFPSVAFIEGAAYALTVSASDPDGVESDAAISLFRTTAIVDTDPPGIALTNPPDGGSVGTNFTRLVVAFDEPMDTTAGGLITINNGASCPAQWQAETQLACDITGLAPSTHYTVTVSNVFDKAQNAIAGPYVFGFAVTADADMTKPSLQSWGMTKFAQNTSPSPSMFANTDPPPAYPRGIAPDAELILEFSEPVNDLSSHVSATVDGVPAGVLGVSQHPGEPNRYYIEIPGIGVGKTITWHVATTLTDPYDNTIDATAPLSGRFRVIMEFDGSTKSDPAYDGRIRDYHNAGGTDAETLNVSTFSLGCFHYALSGNWGYDWGFLTFNLGQWATPLETATRFTRAEVFIYQGVATENAYTVNGSVNLYLLNYNTLNARCVSMFCPAPPNPDGDHETDFVAGYSYGLAGRGDETWRSPDTKTALAYVRSLPTPRTLFQFRLQHSSPCGSGVAHEYTTWRGANYHLVSYRPYLEVEWEYLGDPLPSTPP